jgi:hypothetical protein
MRFLRDPEVSVKLTLGLHQPPKHSLILVVAGRVSVAPAHSASNENPRWISELSLVRHYLETMVLILFGQRAAST